jgi:hypothetical protein
MQVISILALVATALALPSSLPVEERTTIATNKVFTVSQAKNMKFVKNGRRALAKAHHRYSITPTRNSSSVLKRSKSHGTVAATPEGSDVEYLCPVTIDGQVLNLDFDSGSADL